MSPATRTTRAARALIVAVLPVLCAVFPGAASAHAAPAAPGGDPAITWQIQPSSKNGPTNRPYFVYDLKPGARVRDYVGVTNLGHTALSVDVYAADGYNSSDGGAFDVRPASVRPVDIGSWVTLAKRRVTIAPRTRADIPFTLSVPRNATPGDHVGGVVASVTSVSADSSGSRVSQQRRVGTRMYLRVAGPTTTSAKITDVHVSFGGAGNPLHFGETTVRYTITNDGNTLLRAHQKLTVHGPFGLGSWSRSLPDVPQLLPGSSVERTATLDTPATLRQSAELSTRPYRVANPAMPANERAAAATTAEPVATTRSLWATAWWNFVVIAAILTLLGWAAYTVIVKLRARRNSG